MRNSRLAEWILALVTTSDRAAATVGDLMEGAQTRGALWFWASVVGTAFSIMWRDVRAEPGKMAWLAVRANLYGLGWILLCTIPMFLVFFFWGGIVGWTSGIGAIATNLNPWTGGWAGYAGYLIFSLLIPFVTGRWIARKARGREMAVCLAVVSLRIAFSLFLSLLMTVAEGGGLWRPVRDTLLACPLYAVDVLSYFAFTAWARHRSRQTAAV
jgi:hypothetical protein